MFGVQVHVIDEHLMGGHLSKVKVKILTHSLNTQMNRAFSKIVLLWGHGVSQTHLVR